MHSEAWSKLFNHCDGLFFVLYYNKLCEYSKKKGRGLTPRGERNEETCFCVILFFGGNASYCLRL